jgi:hypothetical protein
VEHGEHTDAPAEPLRIHAQCGERIERGAEQRAAERLLVLAHGAAELPRQGEDDVEVRHRQQQVALPLEPAACGGVAAAGAGPVMARVRQHMLTAARGAHGEMAAERTGATARDGIERADVPLRHGRAVPNQVVSSVPDDDVGQTEHRSARLQVDHQAIEHILQVLDSGAASRM